MAYVFGSGHHPCPCSLPLATEHGRARALQERFNEGHQNSISLGHQALLGLTSSYIIHVVCDLEKDHQSLRAPAENAYSGSCTISLCECAYRRKSHFERFSSSDWGGNKATQFVSNSLWIKSTSSTVTWAVRNLFFYHHWSVNLSQASLFSCMFAHDVMPFSVTGGSQSLTIVFGWNVVIKYVFLGHLSCFQSLSLNKFSAWSISQASRISFDTPFIVSRRLISLGTLGGAFVVDYLGAKYTMVSVKLRVGDRVVGPMMGWNRLRVLFFRQWSVSSWADSTNSKLLLEIWSPFENWYHTSDWPLPVISEHSPYVLLPSHPQM